MYRVILRVFPGKCLDGVRKSLIFSLKVMESFTQRLKREGLVLGRVPIEVLQINIGKLCNQACHHCHVEAGPKKIRENMGLDTIERLLLLLGNSPEIREIDITGGAPELNPHFRFLVEEVRKMGKNVVDRCNLTVFFEKDQEDTPEFLFENEVKIVASLPCYSRDNVDRQRGNGVFDKSIRALQRLNRLGYGHPKSGRSLDLVYNPVGVHLPGEQQKLEADYKRALKKDFDIVFNQLYTITNMPIKRFLRQLNREKKVQEYMDLLLSAFNPRAAEKIMCRTQLSVSWEGNLYDCDFNQMLGIPIPSKKNIWEIEKFSELSTDPIEFANHCYGCTAGAGSSCGGALV